MGNLSRIERGERLPDWYTFERLMQRLGERPEKYYKHIVTSEMKRILDTKDEIVKKIQETRYTEAECLLKELEADSAFDNDIQFVLKIKSSLAIFLEKDYRKAYELAVQGLQVTIALFDETKINKYLLTYDEVILINTISVVYFFEGNIGKSLEILLLLKSSLDTNYFDETEKVRTYSALLYNISKYMAHLEQYVECVDICNEGIEFCRKHREAFYPPMFHYSKGYSLFNLKQVDACKKSFSLSLSLYWGSERNAEYTLLKNNLITDLNLDIPTIE